MLSKQRFLFLIYNSQLKLPFSKAQVAFDKAIDAIDRSGLKKDLRKDITADLQEAFINLAKSVEADPPPELLASEAMNTCNGSNVRLFISSHNCS